MDSFCLFFGGLALIIFCFRFVNDDGNVCAKPNKIKMSNPAPPARDNCTHAKRRETNDRKCDYF